MGTIGLLLSEKALCYNIYEHNDMKRSGIILLSIVSRVAFLIFNRGDKVKKNSVIRVKRGVRENIVWVNFYFSQ
jgi:hypothetical protein